MLKLTRRQLLVGAGVAGFGVASGARPGGWSLGGGDAQAAVTASDWSDLRASVRGRLLLPNAPDYPMARLASNSLYDNVVPQAVLQAADARDIQQALQFCRDHGLQPTARSGGHSYQGFSTSRGLVIDLAAMKSVALSADHGTVRIGAGARLLDIYRHLFDQAKVAIPGGVYPMVGISGLTLGGGIGPFVRQYGLTLDRLLAAEIVTADGQLRRISPSQDADLFWAIRGGGGGCFGVVTAFDFATVPVDMPSGMTTLTFPWSAAERVLGVFQTWTDALPLQAHATLILGTSMQAPKAQPLVHLVIWYRGPEAERQACVRAFIREVGVAPVRQSERTESFFAAVYDFYCQGLRPSQCADVTQPPGQLPRMGSSTYSEISRQPWPQVPLSIIVDALERWQRDPLLQPPGVDSSVQAGRVAIEPINGAANRVSPSATAFPHRDGHLIYQFRASVRPGAPAELVAAAQAWVSRLYADLTPWRTGAEYSNYGNRQLRQWATAYYGANLTRLCQIKAQCDPGNLFRFEQSVRSA